MGDEEENIAKITLNLTGKDKGELQESDVVLVINRSGSMNDTITCKLALHNHVAACGKTKMELVKESASSFVDKLLANGQNKIAIVSYGEKGNKDIMLSQDGTAIKGAINSLSAYGGIYMQAGIVYAKEILEASNAKNKYILLLSDAEATYSTIAAMSEDVTEDDITK